MQEQQERINHMGNTIIADATKIADEIIADAHLKADKIIKTAYDKYMRDEESQLKNDKISTQISYQKDISKHDFDAHKEILAHRNKLVEDFFGQINEKIGLFTQSDSYTDYLLNIINEINKEKQICDGDIIFIRKNDIHLKEKISQKYKVEIKIDKNIILGGTSVFYPKENIYINKTLDEKFEAEKSGFVNHTELQL